MKPKASSSIVGGVARALFLSMVALCTFSTATSIATAQDDKGSYQSPRLRCWQEGRLLFEQVGWKTLSVPVSEHAVLGPKSDTGRELYLIQVGQATCLLED